VEPEVGFEPTTFRLRVETHPSSRSQPRPVPRQPGQIDCRRRRRGAEGPPRSRRPDESIARSASLGAAAPLPRGRPTLRLLQVVADYKRMTAVLGAGRPSHKRASGLPYPGVDSIRLSATPTPCDLPSARRRQAPAQWRGRCGPPARQAAAVHPFRVMPPTPGRPKVVPKGPSLTAGRRRRRAEGLLLGGGRMTSSDTTGG
jgi:hypothetical protein